MTTLDPEDGYAVLINTFRVQPERADALVDVLSRATSEQMRHMPGFISANIHVSLDRTRVVNYAQWRDEASFEAMLQDSAAREHMSVAANLADSFEPVLYALKVSHGA